MVTSRRERPWHRRDAGAARALVAHEEASLRSPGKSLRNRPFVRLLAAPRSAAALGTRGSKARAIAVPARASDHSAARRLQHNRRPGDPSPSGSPLRGRRFSKAWLDKSVRGDGACSGKRKPRHEPRPRSGFTSAQVWLSLAGLHLCRARFRFTRPFQHSSNLLVPPGVVR